MQGKSALENKREAHTTLVGESAPLALRPILTLTEVARELRCSKAHVSNIISGKVPYLPPLPILRLGRRLLVRHDAFTDWMLSVEARESEIRRASGFFSLERRSRSH